MVDIVHTAQTVFEVEVVTYRCDNVFSCYVFRRKYVYAVFNCLVNRLFVRVALQNFVEFRKICKFQNTEFLRIYVGKIFIVFIEIILQIYNAVAYYFNLLSVGLYVNDVYAAVLYFIRLVCVKFFACFCDNFAQR